jgi:hypothetical protein
VWVCGVLTFFCLFFLSFRFFLLVLSTLGARPDCRDHNDIPRSVHLFPTRTVFLAQPSTHPYEPVLGLKLLLRLLVIINQPKPSGPPTSKLGLESKRADSALVGLVQAGELFVELGFADGGSGGVEDVDDELSSVEETVGDELAGSDGDRAGGIL